MSKKTLVLGASHKPDRYSYRAVKKLLAYKHEVVAIGLREANIETVQIQKGQPKLEGIHTVTLYMNPTNQEQFLDYIIDLEPQRIIFNPGTWNPKLEKMARAAGIETEEDCTLVMLNAGLY
ncbi:MAG: CoA-binding protein [Bacteroidales bacterium]|jgi:predicted CoA-binding protein|nr:CoA-binding protein [Bacteroidales bacterium]NLM93221.1 CoA-binding protein [Bacteroidales bacterium]